MVVLGCQTRFRRVCVVLRQLKEIVCTGVLETLLDKFGNCGASWIVQKVKPTFWCHRTVTTVIIRVSLALSSMRFAFLCSKCCRTRKNTDRIRSISNYGGHMCNKRISVKTTFSTEKRTSTVGLTYIFFIKAHVTEKSLHMLSHGIQMTSPYRCCDLRLNYLKEFWLDTSKHCSV